MAAAKDEAGPIYEDGEKVLAYHGQLIYQAKVIGVEKREEGWRYELHYQGWSKKWDEWVADERILKETPANLSKQEKLFKQAAADKKKNGGPSPGGPGGPGPVTPTVKAKEEEKPEVKKEPAAKVKTPASSGGKGKKRKSDPPQPVTTSPAVKETSPRQQGVITAGPDQQVNIPLPPSLKKQLVDDWRCITQVERLVKLPRKPTVADVLQRYLEAKTKKDSSNDNTAEVANGLRAYFDRALPAILLYKQERSQYAQALPENSNLTPAEVYGAEHLLRLFIKLPELLSYIQMEEDTLQLLVQKLSEFLRFLQKHQNQFFLSNYDGPKVDSRGEERDVKKESGKKSAAAAR
eukprot:TRINITY_DN35561_c0_g1_i1.p1 TRINITY_DN35561_c0_g1~~TRINITY_DN35561_c0_g1_i1.p1  ORF type:complete len:349 (+),score=105.51 TRINITY_DN35561_c0_g1_i1:468-1514(+)